MLLVRSTVVFSSQVQLLLPKWRYAGNNVRAYGDSGGYCNCKLFTGWSDTQYDTDQTAVGTVHIIATLHLTDHLMIYTPEIIQPLFVIKGEDLEEKDLSKAEIQQTMVGRVGRGRVPLDSVGHCNNYSLTLCLDARRTQYRLRWS